MSIRRIRIIYSLYSKKNPTSYRPVYREGSGPWQRWPQEVLLEVSHFCCLNLQVNEENELEINLEWTFDFDNKETKFYIAFLYPFTYTENLDFLEKLDADFQKDETIYFKKELFVRSVEQRQVHLLTITSNEPKHISGNEETFYGDGIFPERQERPKK